MIAIQSASIFQFIIFIYIIFNTAKTYALINAVSISNKVPIVQINFKNDSHVCSGMFIDENTILTAAHCVSDKKTWEGFSLEVDTITDQDSNKISVSVLKVMPHPNFTHHFYGNDHDVGIIKTSSYKYEGIFPKVSLSRSSRAKDGILYACGRINFLDKQRLCQQGTITYYQILNQIVSFGTMITTDTPGKDVSIAPNDSGGVLIDLISNSIVGVIWGTWSPILKNIHFILNPNFMSPMTKENLDFIQKNQGS